MKVTIELTEEQVKQVMDEIQKVLFTAESSKVEEVSSEDTPFNGELKEDDHPNKKISDDVIEHIRARVDAGESLRSVCEEYNLNYNTIYGRLKPEKKK